MTWYSLSNFFFPFLVLLFCYCNMCAALWKNFKKKKEQQDQPQQQQQQQQQQQLRSHQRGRGRQQQLEVGEGEATSLVAVVVAGGASDSVSTPATREDARVKVGVHVGR